MIKTVCISVLIFITSGFLMGQPPTNRYTAQLFNSVTETTNIKFSTNVPKPNPGGGFYETTTGYPLNVDEFSTSNVNLYMNIFQPTGDTLKKRPVVIICFGGGFVSGSKDNFNIRLIAQELAKRGFVTAVIDYRLGMNVFDDALSMRAVYRGVQDGRSAVRFFKADAAGSNIYRVDPNQIYIGGHSAGAFVATHNAYLDLESERPASTYVWPQGCGLFDSSICWCQDQGCLDCVGDNTSFSGKAKAVFSLAGAVGFTSYLENSGDSKIIMFHSTDDGTVPYNSGQPFGNVSGFIIGFDLPIVYGSLPMKQRADLIQLQNKLNSYTNRGHSVHEATSTTLYSDIVPEISNWFFSQLLQPEEHTISGKKYVCNSDLVQSYSTNQGLATYYHWEVTGGNILNNNPLSSAVTIQWNINAPVHQVKLTPYSKWDAKGTTTTLDVIIAQEFQNTWTATSDMWTNTSNWSLLALPESCHNIVVPNQSIPIEIILQSEQTYHIKSLTIGANAKITVRHPSLLLVQDQE